MVYRSEIGEDERKRVEVLQSRDLALNALNNMGLQEAIKHTKNTLIKLGYQPTHSHLYEPVAIEEDKGFNIQADFYEKDGLTALVKGSLRSYLPWGSPQRIDLIVSDFEYQPFDLNLAPKGKEKEAFALEIERFIADSLSFHLVNKLRTFEQRLNYCIRHTLQ